MLFSSLNHTCVSGFISCLKQNWGFWVKRKMMVILLHSCWRQVAYTKTDAYCDRFCCIVHLSPHNQFDLTFCLLNMNKFNFFTLIVSSDDGGNRVRLHDDLQAAQWSFSPAASQQELHTGGANLTSLFLGFVWKLVHCFKMVINITEDVYTCRCCRSQSV